ncbi:MAG: ComEA family DNA-binding protein [Planctomycetota bacterium]
MRLDPNRARLPELMLLPGIGQQRAEAIILQRIRHGPFRRIEDLAEVPGLGPKTLLELSPYLSISDGRG